MGSVIPAGSFFTPPNFSATNLRLLIADGGFVLLAGGNARRIRALKSSLVPVLYYCVTIFVLETSAYRSRRP